MMSSDHGLSSAGTSFPLPPLPSPPRTSATPYLPRYMVYLPHTLPYLPLLHRCSPFWFKCSIALMEIPWTCYIQGTPLVPLVFQFDEHFILMNKFGMESGATNRSQSTDKRSLVYSTKFARISLISQMTDDWKGYDVVPKPC